MRKKLIPGFPENSSILHKCNVLVSCCKIKCLATAAEFNGFTVIFLRKTSPTSVMQGFPCKMGKIKRRIKTAARSIDYKF